MKTAINDTRLSSHFMLREFLNLGKYPDNKPTLQLEILILLLLMLHHFQKLVKFIDGNLGSREIFLVAGNNAVGIDSLGRTVLQSILEVDEAGGKGALHHRLIDGGRCTHLAEQGNAVEDVLSAQFASLHNVTGSAQ